MLSNVSVSNFIKQLASEAPTPGGGGASALAGALSAALSSMMANLTLGKEKYKNVEQKMSLWQGELAVAQSEFLKLIDDDAAAYNAIIKCYAMPKKTKEEKILRKEKLAKAAQTAALIPLKICENAVKVLKITENVASFGNPMLLTDAGCAAILGMATLECGKLNVKINLPLTHNDEFITSCENKLQQYEKKATSSKEIILKIVQKEFA